MTWIVCLAPPSPTKAVTCKIWLASILKVISKANCLLCFLGIPSKVNSAKIALSSTRLLSPSKNLIIKVY